MKLEQMVEALRGLRTFEEVCTIPGPRVRSVQHASDTALPAWLIAAGPWFVDKPWRPQVERSK